MTPATVTETSAKRWSVQCGGVILSWGQVGTTHAWLWSTRSNTGIELNADDIVAIGEAYLRWKVQS